MFEAMLLLLSVGENNAKTSGGSRGLDGRALPWGSKFFQFHTVFGKKIGKMVCWHLLESWRHNLREILDPPMKTILIKKKYYLRLSSMG